MGKSHNLTRQGFSMRYDRSQKAWIARKSRQTYQHEDKRNVLLWILKQQHPQLWSVVHGMACNASADGNGQSIPLKLVDRLIKAAQLISKGNVIFPSMQVYSQTGSGESYQIRHDGTPKAWTCTCIDFAINGGFNADGYGPVCKHILAIIMLEFLGANVLTRSYEGQSDFVQGMDDTQAKRLHDPEYIQALITGGEAIFWYLIREAINTYTQQLYRRAQEVLFVGDFGRDEARHKEITAQEIRSRKCDESRFGKVFEIRELDGEQYGQMWDDFYAHTRNGQFSRMKAELINAFEVLL